MEITINTDASREDFLFNYRGIELWIKRDDLIHPKISGNKWRKLKYHVQDFYAGDYQAILTFGGAFSNHLAATAAFGKISKVPTYGLVRGEEEMESPTLKYCLSQGMDLEGISRSKYRLKESPEFTEVLMELRPGLYILPEGGKGPQAVKGCAEIVEELEQDYQYLCLSAGTGVTATGLMAGVKSEKVVVYPALKSEGFMLKSIANQLMEYTQHYGLKSFPNDHLRRHLILRNDYHFGGYAKIKPELVEFMNDVFHQHNLKLDPVYTSKMLFGLLKDIDLGRYEAGSKILVLHTGGLQGITGMNEKLRKKGWPQIDYEQDLP